MSIIFLEVSLLFKTHLLVCDCWVMEDVVDTGHLCQYRPITQRVANGSQTWDNLIDGGLELIIGWEHNDHCVQIEEDGSYANDVVKLRAGQFE